MAWVGGESYSGHIFRVCVRFLRVLLVGVVGAGVDRCIEVIVLSCNDVIWWFGDVVIVVCVEGMRY
jgi:hypothetical protein